MLDDTSLVLVADEDASLVGDWLRRLAAHPDLGSVVPVVVHRPELTPVVGRLCDRAPHVRHLAVDVTDPAATVAAVVRALDTGYFTVAPLGRPEPARLAEIASALVTERLRLADVPPPPLPVLLWHPGAPVHLVTAYIDRVDQADGGRDTSVAELLGSLALRAAKVTVQWIEPAAGAVDVAVRLNLAAHRFADRPPWQFRVALTGPAGEVGASAPAGLVERVDATGVAHWEWLVARVDLTGVPSGDYRVEVVHAAEHEALRLSRTARPSNGVLVCARTVRMVPATRHARPVRYHLHTPSNGRQARLRVGRGSGAPAELRWTAQLGWADLRYIARGDGGRRMRLLRLLRLVTAPVFLGRRVWLLGERPDEAQDNGVQLFRYLREHHPRRHVYYVLDRAGPQYRELRRLGHVVPHSSWRHQVLMLHATVIANAHSTHHMVPRSWNRQAFLRRLAWRIGALQVFLQHGVHLSPEAVKRGNSGYDLILTSAPGETRALRAVSGYVRQVAETGLPRFDQLTPTPPSRTVLVMPTWRRYLPSRVRGDDGADQDPFEGSTYERFLTALLTSHRLHAMLETFGYRLVLVPHPNVAEHFAGARTAGARITVATPTGSELQALVRRCDAFLTDHSSVHFDAAYLGTPVVYARFDREEYESRHAAPSWFDFERDGFGPVTTTLEGTLDELEALLARECAPDPRYVGRVDRLFAHRDKENCRRVVEAIDALLASRGRGAA